MRPAALLCFVVATAAAVPTKNYDIDEAICIFPLVSIQTKGINPTAMFASIMPYLTKEKIMTDETRKLLLTAGGLTSAQSTRMLYEVLPALAAERKSTYEQMMALMFVANGADDDVIPYVTLSGERGCFSKHIVGVSGQVGPTDECVCDDQDNVLLWIALLNKIKSAAKDASNLTSFNSHVPDQVPVVMMMVLSHTPCDGRLRGRGMRCKCQVVTEGNEGVLMQLVASDASIKDIISPHAKEKMRQHSREPHARTLSIESLLAANSNASPQLISILANTGASTTEKLMQVILAGRGLDSTTTQLILNGGFGDDPSKIAMINYLANRGLVAADAVPFILGVDQGSQFFIQSMIHSGAIDPVIGLLLLSRQTGSSQSDLYNLITQVMLGRNINLDGITKPYIPALPKGIYPGSKLYFIHLETLGVNTCALHDLRNRFECGFTGISAADCEPVFITDSEVGNMTGGQITTASAIPWCYYNVFFIYYNSFALPVKLAGQFASPASCLSLFKYGLNLDPSIYYLYAQQASSSAISSIVNLRVECGFPGITEFHCVAIRGCCWDKFAPYRVPQCFNANGVTSFNFDLNKVPVAYLPRNLTCSVGIIENPHLFYRRAACSVSWDMFADGENPLKDPTRKECLYKLGCCWEEDDLFVQKYPELPRCFSREDGTFSVRPNNIAQVPDLFARSGDSIQTHYPKASPSA